MALTTKCIPASRLSTDGDVAQWLYEMAAVDEQGDPLDILMQRESAGEFTFSQHEEDGVQYPHFAPSYN
jgi:hypothetical protein